MYPAIASVPTKDLIMDRIHIQSALSGRITLYGEALLDTFEEDLETINDELFRRKFQKNRT